MLLASWSRDMEKMRRCICEHTQLFLQNFESHQLLGPFRAVCNPQHSFCPEAFKGRFGAQVRVKPMLGDFVVQTRIPALWLAGPMTSEEMQELWETLKTGDILSTSQRPAQNSPGKMGPRLKGGEITRR
ncbi:unnamed protein product [Polarella glacialis]|uniref:DCD domain-containing protein n=1 Tax=Polarella glacialis TaxID=89957 RepID=A0A813DH46_POLGL|nr:unnamed protein product [Polarella glacialis]